MDWKKLALCAVLSGASMGLVACGDDDGGGGGGGGGPDNPDDGQTVVYVVSQVTIPENDAATGRAAGFNLDGVVSTGDGTTCVDFAPDFTSLTDPSENGVDNALGELVGTIESAASIDLDETLASQIAEGNLLLLMQVSDIDSFSNDSSVSVRLFLGSVPGGGAPMLSGSTLAPGQTFEGEPLGAAVSGTISGGRLRAQTPRLNLAIDAGDLAFDLVISNAVIGGSISQTAITNGAIGGALRLDDLKEIARQIDPTYVPVIDSIAGPLADLEPSADDAEVCQALSVGLLFGAVQAELSGS